MTKVPVDKTGGSSHPRRKRLKIAVACDSCRVRKIKCDGVRPACRACLKRDASAGPCHYSSNPAGSSASQDDPFSTRQTLSDFSGVAPPTIGILRPDNPPLQRLLVSEPHKSRDVEVDSMTAMTECGNPREYFGSSSAGSFTSQIKAAIDARLGQMTQNHGSHTPHQTITSSQDQSQHYRTATREVYYSLPQRRQADSLLNIYWRYVDPIYPFLDRGSFENSYRSVFNGATAQADERIFMATLNIVLALSTQLQETMDETQREPTCRTFFDRAQSLVKLDIWDTGSIELVQYLLLLSQYLQSVTNPHQTWMVVGTAIRIAQGLGLHLPQTYVGLKDSKMKGLVRRLWHGCVLMDRMTSVTHGRPSMISGHIALAASPSLELGTSGLRENIHVGPSAFLTNSLELYEIINQIMLAFYTSESIINEGTSFESRNTTNTSTSELITVIKLDDALNKLENNLPSYLKLTCPNISEDEILHRRAVIMKIRFLHARMLLLRPVLGKFCLSQSQKEKSNDEESLGGRLIEQCAHSCVVSAKRMITTICEHESIGGSIKLLPAWWYRVYYIYTAATILLAASLRVETFAIADLSEHWNMAVNNLESHEHFGISARRCVAALEILSSKIGQESDDQSVRTGTTLENCLGDTIDDIGLNIDGFDFDINNYEWLNSMPGGIL
ncbi:hypothetical protein F5Y11DRAFT_365044 [Daldinia sp. FL1419]|nr:hypothetical protein F5Y11DRAFT_365044 [Daldinia sp. FL1419]